MSVPPACTVQVLPLTDWLPASAGLPMSPQLQLVGQLTGKPPAPTDTLPKTMVPSVFELCEVAAMPASTDPVMLIVTLEPGTSVQVSAITWRCRRSRCCPSAAPAGTPARCPRSSPGWCRHPGCRGTAPRCRCPASRMPRSTSRPDRCFAAASPRLWPTRCCWTARPPVLRPRRRLQSVCQTKWKVSVVPQMSLPPAVIVQVPLLSDWPPAGTGLPMSAQLQLKGQVLGATRVEHDRAQPGRVVRGGCDARQQWAAHVRQRDARTRHQRPGHSIGDV